MLIPGSRRCCIRYLKCGGGLELGFGKRLEGFKRAWLEEPGLSWIGCWWEFGCWWLSEEGKEKVNVAQSCPTLCNPMDCSLPGFSVHGIFQARILEWGAITFSRGSSRPRDRTWVSSIGDRCFNLWATREAPKGYINFLKEHLIVVKILSLEGKVTIGESSERNELFVETEE